MTEEQEPQKSNADVDDGSPSAPHSSARPSASFRRPSMMSSLRSLIAADSNNGSGDSKDNEDDDDDDDDDDSFVFTDNIHQRQSFRHVSEALVGFGLVADSSDDESADREMKSETDEKTALLNQGRECVPEDKIETKKEVRPYRRESKMNAYHHGQKELFLEVLDQIDEIQNTTRKDKGFKEWKFAFGLVNCLFIAYVFGGHPEHFWILYAIETIFWMSYKFRGMYFAKPLSETFYYLDFCWVMNASGVTIIVTVIFLDGYLTYDIIPIEVRKNMFMACFGVFCGPVFLAAMALPFVAFLFHDVNTMANLIIHMMPSMVMYHHRWHAADISKAYPTIFPHLAEFTEEMNNSKNTGGLTRITLTVYFAWAIPYIIWMLLVGLKLPVVSKDKGKPPPKYDTVFHSTWKGSLCQLVGTAVWNRPKEINRDCSERNDYEIRDFLFYMLGHAVGSCGVGIILIGDVLCFRGGKAVHAALLWFTMIVCAKRGADRYTYYVTSMYGQKLRKAFREIEAYQQQELQKLSDDVNHFYTIEEKHEDGTSMD